MRRYAPFGNYPAVIGTAAAQGTMRPKNGSKWMTDRDPMSEYREGEWTRRY